MFLVIHFSRNETMVCLFSKNYQIVHKMTKCYLTLVLHLLGWSANDIYLRGREANGGVDRDVFGGSIASKYLHMRLELVK